MKKIVIKEKSEVDFREIGKLICIPDKTMKPSIQEKHFKLWGSLGFIGCDDSIEFGVASFDNRKECIDKLERHINTEELLLVLKGDVLLPIAPISIIASRICPDEKKLIAIHLKESEGILFNKNVWHWAPFPTDESTAYMLVAFKIGTAENDVVTINLNDKYEI